MARVKRTKEIFVDTPDEDGTFQDEFRANVDELDDLDAQNALSTGPDIRIGDGTTEVTTKPVKRSAKAKRNAEEKAAAQAKRLEERAAKATAKADAKAAKPKRVPSPYSGFSQHQRNRRIAWDKYGPDGPYDEQARYIIEPSLRAEIHAALAAGTVRPSAHGTSFGGDRYLQGVAKRKWPEDAITILTGEAIVERRQQRAEATKAKADIVAEQKASKAAVLAVEKLAKAVAREADKQAKAVARETAKTAAATARAAEKQAKANSAAANDTPAEVSAEDDFEAE